MTVVGLYSIYLAGLDMAAEFEAEDDATATAVAWSAQSPFGHALCRDGRLIAWLEPGDFNLAEEAVQILGID